MIALDISASMRANDLPPSRLRAAQTVLAGLIPGWTQDRIGLILFSGTSQPLVPLTGDHDALLESLAAADAGEFQLDGTALGDALQSAAGCLEAAREELKRPQAVILATDGNNNRGSDPEAMARELHARGIRLYILGLGGRKRIPRWEEDPQGKWIPLRDGRGERQYWEPLHPDVLQRLAGLAGGDFFSTQAPGEISLALEKIRVLEKRHSQSRVIPRTDKPEEWFVWPLGLALIFLALERGLRRTRWKGINA